MSKLLSPSLNHDYFTKYSNTSSTISQVSYFYRRWDKMWSQRYRIYCNETQSSYDILSKKSLESQARKLGITLFNCKWERNPDAENCRLKDDNENDNCSATGEWENGTGKWSWSYHLIISTNTKYSSSWFEGQSQPKFGALVYRLRVDFTWDGDKWLWTPFVLDQSTSLTVIVHSCFHSSQWVQLTETANSNGILVTWEAVGHLCTDSGVGQWAHYMVVWCTQAITLVIPREKTLTSRFRTCTSNIERIVQLGRICNHSCSNQNSYSKIGQK